MQEESDFEFAAYLVCSGVAHRRQSLPRFATILVVFLRVIACPRGISVAYSTVQEDEIFQRLFLFMAAAGYLDIQISVPYIALKNGQKYSTPKKITKEFCGHFRHHLFPSDSLEIRVPWSMDWLQVHCGATSLRRYYFASSKKCP
jgi:hypothetical protein